MSDGRWPANLITDGSEEVKACFPEADLRRTPRQGGGKGGIFSPSTGHPAGYGQCDYGDTGNASRFFAACPPDEGDYELSDGESSVMPDNVQLYLGDCRDVLREFARMNGTGPRFTAIVTDPPAGISFMGKTFDTDYGGRDNWIAIYTEIARLALDLCLPGAHALVWALPRTSHWTATAWENGGWECRDVIVHAFGSGFPKSLDVSKQLDKIAGIEREDAISGGHMGVSTYGGDGRNEGAQSWHTQEMHGQINKGAMTRGTPVTDLAREWRGYGSALKPACEFWHLLRKPLDRTIAGNCAAHGCGALNIDGARIPTTDKHEYPNGPGGTPNAGAWASSEVSSTLHKREGAWSMQENGGRFPANLITDGSDEVTTCFPSSNGGAFPRKHGASGFVTPEERAERIEMNDTGSAARFFAVCPPDASRIFYAAKASRSERDEGLEGLPLVSGFNKNTSEWKVDNRHPDGGYPNNVENPLRNGHPTVKPVSLMKYLLTLLRQPTVNLVLDPFMGSGSTGVAAVMLGIPFVGIERDPEYFEIARRRIAYAQAQVAAQRTTEQLPLLAETEDA